MCVNARSRSSSEPIASTASSSCRRLRGPRWSTPTSWSVPTAAAVTRVDGSRHGHPRGRVPPDRAGRPAVRPPSVRGTPWRMARPVWRGTISFGLVNVPVKAYTAVRDHDVHFHQLEKKSGSRIRNRKVSEKSGRGGRRRRHRDGLRGPQGPLRHVRQGRAARAQAGVDEGDRGRPTSSRSTTSTRSTTSARTGWCPTATRRSRRTSCCWRRWRPAERVGDRHRRDAQQAVPHGDPPARRRAGDVDDALRRRGRATCRDRRHAGAAPSPTPRR